LAGFTPRYVRLKAKRRLAGRRSHFKPDQLSSGIITPDSNGNDMEIAHPDSGRKGAIRFPMRRSLAVWIMPEGPAWLVLAREHGWMFGSRREADIEARWLSSNLGLPIRSATP
jgi:hypothetical protein